MFSESNAMTSASNDASYDNAPLISEESWWVARVGDMLVWARLRVFDTGPAAVFDSSGTSEPYDSEHSARAALLDAAYRMFDGLDDDDAAELGFDLDSLEPPHGEDEEALREQMFYKLAPRL
jgi:hypothetical protein